MSTTNQPTGSNPVPQPNTNSTPSTTNSSVPPIEQLAPQMDVNPVMQVKTRDDIRHKLNIRCSIRRKPTTGGLPGYDSADRIFKIGASINPLSKKALKGVDGMLEKVLMPSILGIAPTEASFQKEIDEYWNNIGVIIPPDEEAGKEEDKGKVIALTFYVQGTTLKESIERATSIEEKFNIMGDAIIKGYLEFERDEMVFEYILLGYCLKNKEVANEASQMWYSPKIKYYIFDKQLVSTKKFNLIQLKDVARPLFSELINDDNKLNAMLMMFNMLPDAYNSSMDKVVALDEVYDKTESSLNQFISFAKDNDLNLKYLIKLAVKKNKLTNTPGTESYYYNSILLGRSIAEVVLFLKDDAVENRNIRLTLEKEVKEH